MPEQLPSSVIYEYPLQERFRTYLRLEHSFKQLHSALAVLGEHPEPFFSALFAAQELIERSDIRTELSKDLDQQRLFMKRWEQHPQIDQTALQGALQSVLAAADNLQQVPKELRLIKDDRFLASIRNRFAQPGVTGLFELPQLQLWLQQPSATRQQHAQQWLDCFAPIAAAVELQLELTRQQGQFSDVVANNGFWQESCEPLALLRIKIAAEHACYPVISGHRQRFTLRLMTLAEGEARQTDAVSDNVPLAIARCPLLTNT